MKSGEGKLIMRLRQELSFIIRRLIHRRHAERELDEEIRAHLEMEIEKNIADGMSPEDARLAARRSFGSMALSKEDSRAMWGLRSLEIFWQDLRYGVRMLLKNPGFTTIAVLTLALGIGANTAIFSVVNAMLLRPLPYGEADRLVMVGHSWGGGLPGEISSLNYRDCRDQNSVFENTTLVLRWAANLTGQDRPELLLGLQVSAGFFTTLKVQPLLGRVFLPEEDKPGNSQAVVLSYGLWQRRFG